MKLHFNTPKKTTPTANQLVRCEPAWWRQSFLFFFRFSSYARIHWAEQKVTVISLRRRSNMLNPIQPRILQAWGSFTGSTLVAAQIWARTRYVHLTGSGPDLDIDLANRSRPPKCLHSMRFVGQNRVSGTILLCSHTYQSSCVADNRWYRSVCVEIRTKWRLCPCLSA